MTGSLRWASRTTVVVVVATLALIWASASGTLGGFTKAYVSNPSDTVASGSLSFSHSRGACAASSASMAAATSPVPCSSSVLPASSSGSTDDTITNTGTLGTNAGQVRIVGCAPVDLANTGSTNANGAMLPRTGATFNPGATDGPSGASGYLTLAGKGYASSITAANEPNGPSNLFGGNATLGMAVWFRTTTGGPLFGFGGSALDSSSSDNRILYVDSSGKIAFIALSAGGGSTTPAVASGATKYNDGQWHFAYVLFTVTMTVLGIVTRWSAQIYVDGNQVGTGVTGAGSPTSVANGYWHLGWSPVTSLPSNYFQGSLAAFMLDNSGSAAVLPTSVGATSKSELWALDDSGGALSGTTLSGVLVSTSLPGNSTPCSDVTISWTTTNPASTVATTKTLTTFAGTSASAPWTSISTGPAVGAGQVSTITLARTNPSDTYATGLILYAPVQFDFTNGPWDVRFSYQAPAAGSSAGSTIAISSS